MRIEIPDRLKNDFLRFLDVAQSSFVDEDVVNFSAEELEVLRLVESLVESELEGGAARRYPTYAARQRASAELGLILSGRLEEYSVRQFIARNSKS